jgi:hypothetical protein
VRIKHKEITGLSKDGKFSVPMNIVAAEDEEG